MRVWAYVAIAGALTGCRGNVIDAGSNASDGSSQVAAAGHGGPTAIASEIQVPPTDLASDGTALFWVSSVGAGGPVSTMPVGGGPIQSVVPGLIGGGFFAVDDVNVYYESGAGIYRAPKSGGGSPTLVTEATDGSSPVRGATALGSNVYWIEIPSEDPSHPSSTSLVDVKTAPLQGGAISVIAEFHQFIPGIVSLGVTANAVFLAEDQQLFSFPISAEVRDGGTPATVSVPASQWCMDLVSDMAAVYCKTLSSLLRIASDGSTTVLGTIYQQGLGGAGIGFDETYVYWLDSVPVGTVMRAPKAGGTAEIIARDTQPIAIAVDARAIYWSDEGGNIMRLPK
jgi:hypothetical protein